MKTYIVAEVGPNHNGSIEMAKKYVKLLSKIDVDAIKFQLGDPEKIYSKDSYLPKYHLANKNVNLIKVAKKRQLKKSEHIELYNLCKRFKIDYLCTAFDLNSLKFLDKNFNMPYYKIASGEVQSLDLLNYISNKNKPIILSTGMSSKNQIDSCFNYLNRNFKKNITLMHCISSYPTPKNKINMRAMLELKKKYRVNVGFSDHSIGKLASIIAVSLGATIIEKHVTLDKSLSGPDHQSSSTINEFKDLVNEIRNIEIILGSKIKKISKDESNNSLSVKKSIVAKRIIAKNEKISLKNICFKRPGHGISPFKLDQIINKRINKKIDKDKLINLEDIIFNEK